MPERKKIMIVLGIESSCDETAAAIVRDGKVVLSDIVSSQVGSHARYGGVVPEIASRQQLEVINAVIDQALKQAGVSFKDLNMIAVSGHPGLIGCLLVGVSTARALAYAYNIPLREINHVQAHLYPNFLQKSLKLPFVGLVISGGHTNLYYVENEKRLLLFGKTRDDAAGEAFDKVSKLLGLPYPGGPEIEKLARKGNPQAIRFPRAYMGKSLDFSFSGLKTAVLYYLRDREKITKSQRCTDADIAASFQEAVNEVLVEKALQAAREKKVKSIVLGGGVASNKALGNLFRARARKEKIKVYIPAAHLCTDNAVMIGLCAYYQE